MRVTHVCCEIAGAAAIIDGRIVHEAVGDRSLFLEQIYQSESIEYPKFHKMDRLSKAGFIATELLKKYHPGISDYGDDKVGILFANSESSTETDKRFEKSYDGHTSPSPSLFVYTLPNIVMGEIAIRNKWYGESIFGIFPAPAPDFYRSNCRNLFQKGMEAVLIGWLNVGDGLEIKMCFVERSRGDVGIPLSDWDFSATF